MFTVRKFPALAVVAGLLCVMAGAVSADEGGTYAKGYIPEPLDYSHLKSNPPILRMNTRDVFSSTLPASYDLRKFGVLPPVRNQNPYGTCWAHAALGAMESSYLKQGLSGLGTSKDINLSELHLAWFVYKDPDTKAAFTIPDTSKAVLDQGGNASKALALMSRMAGPVSEEKMPYSTAGTVSKDADSKVAAFVGTNGPSAYLPLQLRVLEKYDLGSVDSSNRALVKQMITEHGAVMISYYAGSGATSPEGGATAYFDNSQGTYVDHAVLLVGWDDSFPADSFGTNKPSGNGAWLVRNSWGDNWPAASDGDGYFWMSYEQYIADGSVFIAGNMEDGLKHYGYDDLGTTNAKGYGTTSYGANVFQAGDSEKVESVAFYTRDNNTSYDVYIFDLGASQPSSPVSGDTFTASASGFLPVAGYHTVKLASPVTLGDGHYFSVVLKFESSITTPIATIQVRSGWTDNAEIVPNVSYIGYSMTGWTALTDSNACIKAFTVPASSPSTGLPVNEDNFPDSGFREYLTGKYGSSLSDEQIAAITSLNLRGQDISSLKGLASFTALTSLDISGNPSVDIVDITGLGGLTPDNVITDRGVNILKGSDAGKISFGAHSLILSGKIGLDFYLSLSDDAISPDVQVFFSANSKTIDSPKVSDGTSTSSGYMMTCGVQSIQMAEEITASASYNSSSVTQRYSVSDYLSTLLETLGDTESEDLRNLANAIKDYGHYVQKPLAEANGWEYGVKYATMDYATASEDMTISTAEATSLSNYAIDKSSSTGYTLEMDLELDADTALNIYLTPSGTAITSVTCASGDVVSNSDGSYTVSVTGIPAHKLGDTCTVSFMLGDTNVTVKASALSYAKAVMDMESSDSFDLTALKRAVLSLYRYYTATMKYRESAGY
ncbi:MAG: hypothetical protein IJP86_00610 [Synergistaceae bacterium]|nr:hypothetical protein [Synergistaceae bacterium]